MQNPPKNREAMKQPSPLSNEPTLESIRAEKQKTLEAIRTQQEFIRNSARKFYAPTAETGSKINKIMQLIDIGLFLFDIVHRSVRWGKRNFNRSTSASKSEETERNRG